MNFANAGKYESYDFDDFNDFNVFDFFSFKIFLFKSVRFSSVTISVDSSEVAGSSVSKPFFNISLSTFFTF